MPRKIDYKCFDDQLSHSYSFDVYELITLIGCQTVNPTAVWVPEQFQDSHGFSVWGHKLYQCRSVPFWCSQLNQRNKDCLWNYNGRCKWGLGLLGNMGSVSEGLFANTSAGGNRELVAAFKQVPEVFSCLHRTPMLDTWATKQLLALRSLVRLLDLKRCLLAQELPL